MNTCIGISLTLAIVFLLSVIRVDEKKTRRRSVEVERKGVSSLGKVTQPTFSDCALTFHTCCNFTIIITLTLPTVFSSLASVIPFVFTP